MGAGRLMHHYPWHPGDYLKRTAHWSEDRTPVQVEAGLLRDLAYRRLLDEYYGEEQPIPSKTRLVAIRIRMLKHEDIVASVLKEKFTLVDGFWRQDRADSTVAAYKKKADIARENGKKGGRPPASKPTNNPAGSELDTTKNQKPRTIRDTPLPPEGVELFDKFWSQYPNTGSKPTAVKAFAKALGYGKAKKRATFEEVMLGLKVHLTCKQWVKDNGEYVPLAATWLNQDRWNDKPLQPGEEDVGAGWWATGQGIRDKGLELGIPGPADASPHAFRAFKAAVWLAAGDGPWIDHTDTAYALYVQLRNGGGAE